MTLLTDPRTTEKPTRSTPVAAELKSVSLRYGDNQVLDGLDMTVAAGEIVALIGRSGCGKSTTLRVLAGLADDHQGEHRVSGPPAVAFQEPRLFPWRTVAQNVGYGLTRAKVDKETTRRRASETLEEVGLSDKADAWPLTLSGGQAQRVSLARALVAEPDLLLLDEPFGALDALTRRSMHELLLKLWEAHHFGILLVTHDVQEAVAIADRVVVLDGGSISHQVVVDVPRPRAAGDSELATKAQELLSILGVEK